MTLRGFYRAAALLPLAGLAIAAALRGAAASAELPAGWDWVFPSSITRALVAYALVAGWLWIEFGRRSVAGFGRLVWLAPIVYAGANWALVLGFTLIQGRAGRLWEEHSGAILLRTGAHLVFGYAYVALAQVARRALRDGGRITDEEAAT